MRLRKNILITGADGLLGRSLTHRLSQLGFSVTGIIHSAVRQPNPTVEYRILDLSVDWSIDALPRQVDTVIHLAQSANFRDFPSKAIDVFKVNIESTARLLDYAKQAGAKQFVYASSGGVYGNGAQARKETANLIPLGQLGYYLGSKTCGEILVQSYALVFQVVVLRPFFMYGPGQNRSMLIPRLMDSVAASKRISLQGENGIRINPIHVEDASTAVAATLSLQDSATFNVAGPEVLSIRDICEGMGKFLGKEPVFELQTGQPNDLIADITAMRERLVTPKRRLLGCLGDVAKQNNA
jgi:UDP-glucose 4-epimerase